jgi:hypothetical protein
MDVKIPKVLSRMLLAGMFVFACNQLALASEKTYFLTSASLLTFCQSNLPLEDGICQGYLAGVADSIYSGHQSDFVSICIPNGINSNDLKSLFVQYATDYPEYFGRPADGLFTDALLFKFSC